MTLTLSGIGPDRRQLSDEKGQFRFLGLDPGTYELTAELEAYAPVHYESVAILVGRTTGLQLLMSESPAETIVVTAGPSLIADRNATPGIRFTQTELAMIPTSRDPWSIADQAPGVLLTGVNVGGDETGQQPAFVGPGARHSENGFAIDGVVITDMDAAGYSTTYYDFEQFDAVEVTVGGVDAATSNSGVLINMVTRRGTDDLRFSGRALRVDPGLQATPQVDPTEVPAGQTDLSVGRFESLNEIGIEGGGPFIRGRVWGWGSFATTEVRNLSIVDTPDRTRLETFSFKVNAQPSPRLSTVFALSTNDKQRDGIGAGPNRSPETLWRQSGPFRLARLETTRVFGSDFYLSALLSRTELGFGLSPAAGPLAEAVLDENGVWRGGYATVDLHRDSDLLKLEGATFVDRGRGNHELGFGSSLRRFDARTLESWGERQLINVAAENSGNELDLVEALRQGKWQVTQDYGVLWLQDTWKTRRRTINLGLHYDLQHGSTPPIALAASPVFPELLPAFELPAHEPVFRWSSLSPRLGVSYSLGAKARTVVSGSYSRFASQLTSSLTARESPQGGASLRFEFEDLNGDRIYDAVEPTNLLSTSGVDPEDPFSSHSPNRSDPDLEPEFTDEVVLGARRELRPELVVGLDLSLRRVSNILETRTFLRTPDGRVRLAERDDYLLDRVVSGTLPDGGAFSVPVYSLASSLEYTGGELMVNGDREQRYTGATLSVNKRLSRRWMLRGQLTASDWRWEIGPEAQRFDDPTDEAAAGAKEGGAPPADSDGDIVAQQVRPYGRDDGFFLNSSWSFNLSGAWQVAPDRPWGFVVAGKVSGREGFPLPLHVAVTPSDGLTRLVQVTSRSDQFRLDDLYLVDLRLEKEVSSKRLATTFAVDAFNLFNRSAVLQRSHRLNGPQPLFVEDLLGPRVLRLGVRLAWN